MATVIRRFGNVFIRRISIYSKPEPPPLFPTRRIPIIIGCGCVTGAVYTWYSMRKGRQLPVMAKESEGMGEKQAVMQTQRELRFLSFASVEYEGNIYMTPQDFLESVTEEVPRPRTGRSRIFRPDVDRFLKNTPARRKGSQYLFRSLHDKGIISYTEYLFLLCVLTKPISGFRIAFNMFDTDGDQRVDKKEFLVLEKIITMAQKSFASSLKKNLGSKKCLKSVIGDMPTYLPDTTILVHFFGRRGREEIKYEDFHNFMENLQTEVLELEFNEFAKGMPTITEEEFAHILLRYTILSKEEHGEYILRLRERIPHSKGISFKDFKEFGMFLNNLDDFSMAIRMYTYADQPVSEAEFKRAVKVTTGTELDSHLVHTVFQLFDIDGDGDLSHKEFVSVMKDRIHRGFKQHLPHTNRIDVWKQCIKNEMKRT